MAGCGQACPANAELICTSCSTGDAPRTHMQLYPAGYRYNVQYYWTDNDDTCYWQWKEEHPFGWDLKRYTEPAPKRFTESDIEAVRRIRAEKGW